MTIHFSIQYAAGFFDGEGSIAIQLYRPKDGGLPTPHVRVAVSNYIELPIRLIQKRWGGSVHQGKRDDVFTINLNGDDAYRFLSDVFPYLIVKKTAASQALLLFRASATREKLEFAYRLMTATRAGYRAKRTDKTYNEIKNILFPS